MFERLVKLHSERLEFHTRFESVGRLGSPANELVNLLFEIDDGLIHGEIRIGQRKRQSKGSAFIRRLFFLLSHFPL